MAHHPGIIAVESGPEVDFLRIEAAVGKIGSAVDHVQSIDARDADVLHGLLLDLGKVIRRLRTVEGVALQDVQDGSYLVLAEEDVHLRGIHVVAGIVRDIVDGDLDHLAHLLLQGHSLEDLFHFRFHVLVRGDGGIDGGGLAAAGDEGRSGQDEGKGLQGGFDQCHQYAGFSSINFQR